MIKLITLDLDNTLWEAEPVIYAAHRAMCDWLITHVPGSAPLLVDEAWRALRVSVARERKDIAYHPSLMRMEITRALLAPMALPPPTLDTIIKQSFNVFHAGRNLVKPYPEAVELLEYLHSRVPVVAVTNGNSDLEKIGIAHFFTAVVSAENAGVAKPHPDIFRKALRLAGEVSPTEALHVGDHFEEDVAAAHTLGFKTIWFNQSRQEIPASGLPYKMAHSPAELKKMLCELV